MPWQRILLRGGRDDMPPTRGGGSARGRVAANRVQVSDQGELHGRVVVSAEVHVDVSVLVLSGEGERLRARRPLGREPTVSWRDLETDPLEGVIDGESDR